MNDEEEREKQTAFISEMREVAKKHDVTIRYNNDVGFLYWFNYEPKYIEMEFGIEVSEVLTAISQID